MRKYPFYVYALEHEGQICYIGKGSNNRLSNQKRHFGLPGYEMARFAAEDDALAHEIIAIAELKPWLNIHQGGNGQKTRKGVPHRPTPRPVRSTNPHEPHSKAWLKHEMQNLGFRFCYDGTIMYPASLLAFPGNEHKNDRPKTGRN